MEASLSGHSPVMQQAPNVPVPAPRASEPRGPVLPDPPPNNVCPPAFHTVYETCFDFVWRSARRLGVPEASLDDVVQDVFVTVYRRLPEFEGRSQIKTWVFSILRHTVRDLRRSQRRKPTEALEREPRCEASSPLEAAARREASELLHQVLLSLEEEQREVFVLAELEQMSAPEIGDALEVNVNTVYSRLRAARLGFDAALKRVRSRDEWRMR